MSNVLVTCGGKWVSMVRGVAKAMRQVPCLAVGRVIVADRASLTPAGVFATKSVQVPPLDDPGYADALLAVCTRERVRVLLPIIDIDLNVLARHAERFAAAGTAIVCPPTDAVDLCFDKERFHAFAAEHHLNPVPVLDRSPSSLRRATYPLFAKRPRGFGSIGAGRVDTPEAAMTRAAADPELIFQPFIDAVEVSVDGVLRSDGRLVVAVQRRRDKVVGGESWQSTTISDPKVRALTMAAAEALHERGVRGPVNLQCFLTSTPQLIEVNPRLGSASVFSDFAAGGRLIASVLALACGEEPDGDADDYAVGVSLYRFLGDVYHRDGELLGTNPPPPA